MALLRRRALVVETHLARRRFQRLVVPFATPLMIGPGAISAVIINAGEAAQLGYAGMAGSVAAIAAACVVSCICFALIVKSDHKINILA